MGIRNLEERRVIVGATVFEKVENIRVGKSNPRNKLMEGISGEIAQIKRSNRLGFIEIDILESSSENQKMQTLFDLDQNFNVLIQDDSGVDTFIMSSAAPIQDADSESSDDEGATVTWRFEGAFNVYNKGGNS